MFIGSVEMALMMVRRTRTVPGGPGTVPEPPAGLNGHGNAATGRFADELARREVPGIRRIRKELKLGQPRAQQIRECLTEVTRT